MDPQVVGMEQENMKEFRIRIEKIVDNSEGHIIIAVIVDNNDTPVPHVNLPSDYCPVVPLELIVSEHEVLHFDRYRMAEILYGRVILFLISNARHHADGCDIGKCYTIRETAGRGGLEQLL